MLTVSPPEDLVEGRPGAIYLHLKQELLPRSEIAHKSLSVDPFSLRSVVLSRKALPAAAEDCCLFGPPGVVFVNCLWVCVFLIFTALETKEDVSFLHDISLIVEINPVGFPVTCIIIL